MPRTKTAEAGLSAAAEPKKKRAAVSKPASGVHKHATNKAPKAQPEPVRIIDREDIARLAYSYWEARGYQGGSEQEDWLRAERELSILA
jgi:Protein of unknown function (DUF2934).